MANVKRLKSWAGFRSVLCPVDFSPTSRLSLRYAAALAARGGGSLSVLYAADPLVVATAAIRLHDQQVLKRIRLELERFVDRALSNAPSVRERVKVRVAAGVPVDEILKRATSERADVIVMGTHGLTGPQRVLIGSTTLSVLQQTSVPVLAIPGARDGASARASLASWPSGPIVTAIELDRRAPQTVDTAASIAAWFECPLLLLHVIESIDAPSWLQSAIAARDQINIGSAEQMLDTLVTRARRQVETTARLSSGRVIEEIASLIEPTHGGLLITTLQDRRHWFGARRGSISYRVLSQAVAPVLACPPHWRPR